MGDCAPSVEFAKINQFMAKLIVNTLFEAMTER